MEIQVKSETTVDAHKVLEENEQEIPLAYRYSDRAVLLLSPHEAYQVSWMCDEIVLEKSTTCPGSSTYWFAFFVRWLLGSIDRDVRVIETGEFTRILRDKSQDLEQRLMEDLETNE